MSALYSCLKGKNDAIMAANTSEETRNVEPEETHEEISGKKKSKFQAFKKFFVKKKRKECTALIKESNLKPSQSSSDVSAPGAKTTAFHDAHEPVAKGNMGNKAVSHDSVFISEMESSVKEDISQECTPGKVKALQLQLQQNIRIGSPPQGIVSKKLEDSGTLSEDDGLPRSPPEITSLHDILAQSLGKSSISAQRRSSISLGGTDSEDEPESSDLSSRPTSPLHSNAHLCPTSRVSHFPLADFTSPASSVTCLDNSAAKHKILVKPKKRRTPTMNAKPTQTKEQQPVKISDSEKSSVKHEAPSEEVKNTEDAVLKKPNEDVVLTVCQPQMDALNSNNSNIPLLLEVSLFENQMVSFQNEAVYCETDVDFHGSQGITEDEVDNIEEDLERDELTTSPQTNDFQPRHENNITVVVNCPGIDNVESPDNLESPDLNVGHDLVLEAEYEPNLEEVEVVCEIEDEYNDYSNVLPDVQNDLLNVTESDLVASETLLSIEQATEVQVTLEHVPEYEGNDEEHLDTIDIIYNREMILVSDQLVSNDEGKNEHSPSDWSITEGKDDEQSNITDSKASAVTTDTGDCSYTKVITSTHDFGILAKSETSTEILKDIKEAEPNLESNAKGSNKPVRFTVAPAWQRALSSGSSVKDGPSIKNVVGNIVKSDSFEGADESVVQSSSKNGTVPNNTEESCGHFGVRLRRTSSSVKYSGDHQEPFSKQGLFPVDTSSLLSGKNLQTPKRTQVNTDCVKMSKMSSTYEEKSTVEIRSQPKPRAEDHSPQENSEPAWITMAKLKQKGFQEHPLAREQGGTTENEKLEGTECIQKKCIITSPEEVEEKRSEQAAADSPGAPVEARPDSENTHSTQPQNPDEPPWFSLAKKKAKAWSERPQIVQQ